MGGVELASHLIVVFLLQGLHLRFGEDQALRGHLLLQRPKTVPKFREPMA
jgi:hypothetical protein